MMQKAKKAVSAFLCVALLCTMLPNALTVKAESTEKKLMASYDMSVENGALKDTSGNGYDAPLVGLTEADVITDEDTADKNLVFPGDRNKYVKLPRQIVEQGDESFTVAMRFKTVQKAFTWVFNLGTKVGRLDDYVALNPIRGGGEMAFLVKGTGQEKSIIRSDAVKSGEETCAVMVFNGSSASIYLNGVLQGTLDHGFSITDILEASVDKDDEFIGYLGLSVFENDPGYQGSISSFRVYNYAMTAEEAALTYDEMKPVLSDEKKAEYDKNELEITSRTDRDISLPLKGKQGSVISWKSSNPDVLSDEGKVGHPAETTEVILTATIENGTAVLEKEFTVTVAGEGVQFNYLAANYDMSIRDGKLTDYSGRGNDAEVVGFTEDDVVWDEKTGESSLHFTESGRKYIKLPAGILEEGNENLTITTKFQSNKAAFSWLFYLGTIDRENYIAFDPIRENGDTVFLAKLQGNERAFSSPLKVPMGKDTSVTLVFRENHSVTTYINGENAGTLRNSYAIADILEKGVSDPSDCIGYIGKESLWYDTPFVGTVYGFQVYNYAMDDAEVAAVRQMNEDKERLSVDSTAMSDLELPVEGENGSVIEWTSSDEAVISHTGKIGDFAGEKQVTLTASIRHEGAGHTLTKSFDVSVLGGNEARLAWTADHFDLGISYVTEDIVLPNTYQGLSITWTGNDAIDAQGKVTRGTEDKKVTLTAEFRKDGWSKKRTFAVTVAGKTKGYLATYIAKYEPDIGVEFAQFPSKEYTDNYRTDVMYYGLSEDGNKFTALNNNKAVVFPTQYYKLGSPSLFRKPDGTYGLIGAVDNKTNQILLYDSEDLIFFENQRVIDLAEKGNVVKNPKVVYDNGTLSYHIYWEGGDGKSYQSDTTDFKEFTAPAEVSYQKEEVTAALPDYASQEEASVFALTAAEYDRVKKKYEKLHSVSVEVKDIETEQGDAIELPKSVDVVYSDGSKTPMGVKWDTSGMDINNLKEGEYTIKGTVQATTEYNSPLALYRADPYAIYDEENKVYYFTGSDLNENSANGGDAYERLVLRKSDTINGITNAEEAVIWDKGPHTAADGSVISGWYWAPELHKMGGKWRIIAMAHVIQPGESEKVGRPCIFTCNGDDLLDPDNWEYTGYIHSSTNGKGVGVWDTTYFEYEGQSYYVTPSMGKIWITAVDPTNPCYPTGPLICISSADRAFESNIGAGKAFNSFVTDRGDYGQTIEEASAVLIHGDKIFVAYAGCTVDMMYCVCLLYADLDSDWTNPDNWKKYPYPILNTADLTTTVKQADFSKIDLGTASGLQAGCEGSYKGTFGPGHNSFTVDENGNPVIVYHARDWDHSYPGAVGAEKYGLVDPGRHAYARSVIFDADGFPVCNLTSEELLADDLKQVSVKVTVKKGIPISKAQVSAIPSQVYNGKAKTPSVTVKYQGKTLVKGKDYTVSYQNNKKIGTAQVTITGMGDYTGSRKVSFVISVKKNGVYTAGKYRYKITNARTNGKGTVAVIGVKSKAVKKKLKKITVGKAVTIGGKKFLITEIGKNAFSGCTKVTKASVGANVTKIGKKAFYGCKKLKKLTIKSKKIKSAGKNALKNIHGKAVIKVPKGKLEYYKNRLKSKGQKKSVKIIS